MSRKPLKVISNKETKFIPEEYKDLDENAEKMVDKPLIFWGKKLNRDQKYTFQEKMRLEYPEDYDPKDESMAEKVEVKGKGEAYKFIFDECITRIENVILSENGEIEEVPELKGKAKQRYWDTEGDDVAILSAVTHFMQASSLDEEEAKN